MKAHLLVGGIATAVLLACTTVEVAPRSDDSPSAVPPTEGKGEGADAGSDAIAPLRARCSEPLAPVTCSTLAAAPVGPDEVSSFVQSAAIPLRCGTDEEGMLWDVQPLVDLFGDQAVFMMGEVHGTNEIGIVSSIIFEQLARQQRVNVLAFEVPMDFASALDRWVQTGKDPMAERFLEALAPNVFANILTRTARELVKSGIPVHLAAIDYSYDPELPAAAIRDVASRLTTQAGTVLDTLPAFASGGPTKAELAQVDQYFDHIIASKEAICSELTPADCERLVAMTHALWVATFLNEEGGSTRWFARREEVIYYNLKTALPNKSDRMFLHMGAAHTDKRDRAALFPGEHLSAGSRLAHEFEPTKDRVLSIAPAYGDGSVIWYANGEYELPGTPETLTSALTHTPDHPLFVSTTRPSTKCEKNPLGLELVDASSATRAETYDGYIHYGRFTSEKVPTSSSFDRDTPVATPGSDMDKARQAVLRYLQQRAKVEANERAVLEARRRHAIGR